MRVQKQLVPVFAAIVFIWIATLGFEAAMGSISSDIVKGTCVPWGAYTSYTMQKAVPSVVFVVAYLLPLIAMAFCYSKIVYTLKNKVIP